PAGTSAATAARRVRSGGEKRPLRAAEGAPDWRGGRASSGGGPAWGERGGGEKLPSPAAGPPPRPPARGGRPPPPPPPRHPRRNPRTVHCPRFVKNPCDPVTFARGCFRRG